MITLATTSIMGWSVLLIGIVAVAIFGAAVRERDLNKQHNRRNGRSSGIGGATA